MTYHSTLLNKYGPWTVVTGVSSGIGAEFSRKLAAAGFNVVLVARRTKVIQADLATPDGFNLVLNGAANIDVGLLVNNAGIGSKGSFLRDDIEYHQRLVAVNVTSVMSLAYGFAKRFSRRERSAILFVSSMLNQPAPYFAPYCSSKAFVTNLALTLRAELEKDGVDISVLEPGFVKSELSGAVIEQMDMSKVNVSIMETNECVGQALAGLAGRRPTIVPGFSNKVRRFMSRLIPESMSVRMMASVAANSLKPELLKHA